MDRTFICVRYDHGVLFLNLYQITRASKGADEDTLTLHLSDGSTYHLQNREATEKLFALLVNNSMSADGEPLEYTGQQLERGRLILITEGKAAAPYSTETDTPEEYLQQF